MSARLCCLLVVVAAGCRSPHWGAPLGGDPFCGGPSPHAAPGMEARPDSCPPQDCPAGVCPPSAPPPCKEIHVTAPRQKVRVQQPGAAPAAQQQLVEQQIAQTRQLVLIPQQVYVPFVQATNLSAVRVNGAQQTQFFNAQGIATQGVLTQGAAAAGIQGVAAETQGAAAGTQGVAGAGAAATQSAAELQQCMEALREATKQVERLRLEVKELERRLPK